MRKGAATWLLWGVLGAGGFALLHLWTPSGDVRFSVCLSRRLLGLPCPGCGMTRALAHLAKGEWRAALAAHPLSPLVAAELALGWMFWGAGGRWTRHLEKGVVPALLANLALLTALWAGRLASGALPR